MLLVLNKYDLVEELIQSGHEMEEFMTFDYLQNFAEEHGFIGAVCTSARTGVGVTEAVAALVRNILIRELQEEECNACEGNMNMANDVYGNNTSKSGNKDSGF